MTDLEFENREKKIIAGSARHKRSGRNSRRCRAPGRCTIWPPAP